MEEFLVNLSREFMNNFAENWDEIAEELIGFLVIGVVILRVVINGKKATKKAQQRQVNQNNPYAQGRTNTNVAGNRANSYAPQMQVRPAQSSAMPHVHRPSGVYDTYNKKSGRNDSGTMPHKHESGHYTSMMDVSKLPKGYILLNGEPVRVADLEGK